MRNILRQTLLLLLFALFIFLSFFTLKPFVNGADQKLEKYFSTDRAFKHVEKIAQEPHYLGAPNHSKVRNYIVNQFQQMGMQVHTQNGYILNDFRVLANPENIITQIKGQDPKPGNDVLVLAHYDSDPHSSYGASDDGAAVAAILEGVRALKVQNFSPQNNIIICITDAEEIGLLGAQLFAEQGDLIRDIGLVLNFEARGTSGPANTIIETNHGNAQLVKDFSAAKPHFPMASSLMYEVYQNMPNDTDATVFRVEKDIPSFFFAFIGEHYNYHAATDSPKNLDKKSLAHQGSYLMALLPYFGQADLTDLDSTENQVYFNFPFFKVIHYDYSWIFPLLFLGWISFGGLLFWGIRQNKIKRRAFFKGFLALLITLMLVVILGYFGWKAVLHFYPQYREIQQGFPYNGRLYIAAFSLLSMAIFFAVYHFFGLSKHVFGLYIAPLVLWLLINTGVAIAFKGASYFVIPMLFYELVLILKVWKQKWSPFLFLLCSIPAIYIFSSLVVYIPVALGMQMVYGGLILLVLLFGLLLPFFSFFKNLMSLAFCSLLGGIIFLISAHFQADFTSEQPKPNSLVYVLDKDKNEAHWKTYDHLLDDWTTNFIVGKNKNKEERQIMASKYGAGFTYANPAQVKAIPGIHCEVKKNRIRQNKMRYQLDISQERTINRMEIFSTSIREFQRVTINGIPVKHLGGIHSKIRKTDAKGNKRLLTYYPVDEDILRIRFTLPVGVNPSLKIFGASYDLLDNPWIIVPKRDSTMMPKPFVLNDAIITKQIIKL